MAGLGSMIADRCNCDCDSGDDDFADGPGGDARDSNNLAPVSSVVVSTCKGSSFTASLICECNACSSSSSESANRCLKLSETIFAHV